LVIGDIVGLSGRRMIEAMINGVRNPWELAALAHHRIKASFVPEQEMQELRSLLRARKQLTREQTRHVQRIQRTRFIMHLLLSH
jgi:histidinol-phosphate/aromatic aminotransferase/cobyric acid decarboxylase-like protein